MNMTKTQYLESFSWIIPLLISDLLIPIIGFLRKFRKKDKLKIDSGFIFFVLAVVVADCLVAYIVGAFSYVGLNDKAGCSYVMIWIVALSILFFTEIFFGFLWVKREPKAKIEISMSPNDYKELILNAEKGAKTIWLMPKRMHVMFKSDAFIDYLAVKRFGEGSEYIQAYKNEHIARKSALYQGLNNGLVIHELHNKGGLVLYIKKQSHSGVDNIEKGYFVEMLNEWKRILALYPNNYFVRLTDENLPLKYELINKKRMVMHESVGNASRDRFNAIFIEDTVMVDKISNDFSQIWERVDPAQRNNQYTIKFIDTVLLPLLK